MVLAEQLVGEARARRARAMDARERRVTVTSAALFLLAALALALVLPSEREASPVLVAGLIAGYALVSRVRFEFGGYYVVPEQLVYVPMLLLAPLPYVPLMVAAAGILALVPDFMDNLWHRDRWVGALADCWSFLTPVPVLALLAPGTASLDFIDVYLLALAAQLGTDLAWTLVRDRLLDQLPLREVVSDFAGTARVDAILSPVALVIALSAADAPLLLPLTIGPLVWLLAIFSRDRSERYAKTLELHRAYRGTVMLLSDVVEFDDPYTAQHSRSIVDLVQAVADELGVNPDSGQELEFAALLHDVGKISIPKEILNKPAKLTEQEFEIMKTHTIEGQFMLDRVGGLLGRVGEIVRSCHERWDGGGYPDGLVGEEIPLASRIVFACDAYNAMTTDRVYRPGMPKEEALAELASHAGTQFDPEVVAALAKVVEEGEPFFAPLDQVRAVLANRPVPHRVTATS
jgi:HD-GYP domain-containing protein (c-di-GMP phosphodiesterase class II)